jgi:hypothetical protein
MGSEDVMITQCYYRAYDEDGEQMGSCNCWNDGWMDLQLRLGYVIIELAMIGGVERTTRITNGKTQAKAKVQRQ